MAISVRRVKVRKVSNLPDRPGTVAEQLATAAAHGVGLASLVAYTMAPGESGQAWIVLDDEAAHGSLADQAGAYAASGLFAILVTGDNRVGAGAEVTRKLASAGLNTRFLQAMGVGGQFAMLVGFGSDADAARAEEVLAG
jgi:hypothetical protein